MGDHTTEKTSVELRRIFKQELSRPFPYDDCRRVLANAGKVGEGFIPDLDLYFSGVAGYCSRGKTLLNLSYGELAAARTTLERSFFDMHPEYLPLAARINEIDTPALFAELNLHDELRGRLLELLSKLLAKPQALETIAAD